MIVDRLDADTAMSTHVQSDGSNIGGVDPLSYGFRVAPSRHPSWLMWSSGAKTPGWPAWMLYPTKPRPILPNTGNLALSFDLWHDTFAAVNGNVTETDTILVENGLKFNLSGQRHNATGQIDIDNWWDSGERLGTLEPNVKHRIRWTYSFNLAAKTCSVLSYECDGMLSGIPAHVMPATPCTWPNGVYPQIQMGSLPAGLPWSMQVGSIKLKWS